MATECIHGLDEALCDLCTPNPVARPVAGAPKVTRSRVTAATTRRSTTPRVAGTAGASVARGDQRLYHLTHITNLDAILASGALLADAQHPQPEVDISSADNREERRAATVGAASADAPTVSDFVPLFVSPDSAMWQGMRAGMPDPRLAAAVRSMAPAEFVVLVTTVEKAAGTGSVVALGDAADVSTPFSATAEQARRELGRMRGDEELSSRAELLVHERLSFDAITLIGVANDRARNAVRDSLAATRFTTKVSIYPPWFARP